MNLKVRFKNPVFWAQLILAIATPILAYANITVADVTTWAKVGELIVMAVSNPFIIGTIAVSIWNALNDPTTAGVTDSAQAMTYNTPKKDGE